MTWSRFKKYFYHNADLGVSLDISRMPFADDFFSSMEPQIQKAYDAMTGLEAGSIANPDAKRMVGHYWLRAPELAPSSEITDEILETNAEIERFVHRIHSGQIVGKNGPFENVLMIGIGGSALGPQFVAQALGGTWDQMAVFFVLVVAAAEVVVGLAIIVAIFRLRQTASVADLTEMKG